MLARLRENLHRHVVGNQIVLDEGAQEGIFGVARGGEADLDLLEADFDEQFEKLDLLLQRHRLDERLIAVAQVDAAPHGCALDAVLFRPVHAADGRHKILLRVFLIIFHDCSPFLNFKHTAEFCGIRAEIRTIKKYLFSSPFQRRKQVSRYHSDSRKVFCAHSCKILAFPGAYPTLLTASSRFASTRFLSSKPLGGEFTRTHRLPRTTQQLSDARISGYCSASQRFIMDNLISV